MTRHRPRSCKSGNTTATTTLPTEYELNDQRLQACRKRKMALGLHLGALRRWWPTAHEFLGGELADQEGQPLATFRGSDKEKLERKKCLSRVDLGSGSAGGWRSIRMKRGPRRTDGDQQQAERLPGQRSQPLDQMVSQSSAHSDIADLVCRRGNRLGQALPDDHGNCCTGMRRYYRGDPT